jgi:hypothetical protein
MKYYISFILLALLAGRVKAQELFVFSEPASNMPAKSIGLRLSTQAQTSPDFRSRTTPEVMIGFNKRLMGHVQGFFSNADGAYRFEGASLYAKYRFLSHDGIRTHSRAAAFLRVSDSKRMEISEDINLEGDNSGIKGGFVFTQLIHKLALSATFGYARSFHGSDHQRPAIPAISGMEGMPGMENMPGMAAVPATPAPDQQFEYSLSSGYLVLPVHYKNYKQPNFNVYFEVLGSANPDNGHTYLDFAPALQMIINSVTRFDLGYRFQVSGNMLNRYNKNMYMAKVEFNLFNALR